MAEFHADLMRFVEAFSGNPSPEQVGTLLRKVFSSACLTLIEIEREICARLEERNRSYDKGPKK